MTVCVKKNEKVSNSLRTFTYSEKVHLNSIATAELMDDKRRTLAYVKSKSP